jgi:hypothetical protein
VKAAFIRFWEKSKWIILSVGAVIIGVLAFMLRGMFVTEPPEGPKQDVLPDVATKLMARVQQVEEEAIATRIRAQVQAEDKQVELIEIAAIPDGVERRKRLAEMLRRL